MFVSSADRPVLPNPWRWSHRASLEWQIIWVGILAVGALATAALLLVDGGRGAVALTHIVIHELGHAALAGFGEGQLHEISVSPNAGHALHAPGSDTQAALVSLAGLLAPAMVAAFVLFAGVTRQGLEVVLLILAACMAGTASFAITDGPATELGLYLLAAVTMTVACLPGAALVKAVACLVWTVTLSIGLWNASPTLFTEPPPPTVADHVAPTDCQRLASLFGVDVHDVATWVFAAQIAIPAFAALWAANWIARYR